MPKLKLLRRNRVGQYVLLALLGFGLSLVFSGYLLAQKTAEPSVAQKNEKSPPAIELDEKEAAAGVFQTVDKGFGIIVDWMETVFFYRIGRQEQRYIKKNHLEYYVRDRGSSGPFEKLDPQGTFEPDELTVLEAEALQARGMLVLSGEKRRDSNTLFFRKGIIEERPVDYITVIIDTKSKYVYDADADVYRKQLEMQELISQEEKDELSQDDVIHLSALGRLELDKDKVDEGEKDPHILSENVGGVPIVVAWLSLGAIFFTFYMRGFNLWGFRHALAIVRGKYDNPDHEGEISHFQALSSALSATVGLGNIAGVTIAMTLGGAGAFFWMLACGFFGMMSKFVECTLGQKYRTVKPDGTVLGGPMQYLSAGLKELGLARLGTFLAIVFAIMCIMASFGGGNMFQANQASSAVQNMFLMNETKQMTQLNKNIKEAAEANKFEDLEKYQKDKHSLQEQIDNFSKIFIPIFGLLMAVMVGVVIIGGIKRIGAAASKVVPTMCIIYVIACLWIILMNYEKIPELVGTIFSEAFTGKAIGGGFIGVLIIGIQRAAFSNEAGVGSAAIAHSAAKTDEPIREGAVAMLGPFVDTIVVCSMTALVILITGAWSNEEWVVSQQLKGAALASTAFGSQISWFPYIFSVAVLLFAYSTIISWTYYGERCCERLFGLRSIVVYRVLAVSCVFIGTIVNLGAVLKFSDFMILTMAFPNILGLILLTPKVKRDLDDYWRRYRAGEFKIYK